MKKIVSTMLTMAFMISMVVVPTHAANDNIVKEIEANYKEVFSSLQTQMKRTFEEEKEAIGLYDELVKQISTDVAPAARDGKYVTVYPDNYAGAYLREDGTLVVCMTADKSSENSLKIEEVYEATDRYTVETVQYSLNQLKLAHSELVKCLSEYSGLYSPDSAEYELFSSIVGMGTNQMANTVYVHMKNVTDAKIQLFDEIFGDTADVYSFVEVGEAVYTATLRPGAKIFPSISGTGSGSIGFRASFTDDDGDTHYGFTTAGHCLDAGQDAYYTSGASRVKIGTALVSMESGSVDGCFVSITNSSYTMSDIAAYSDDIGSEDDAPTISATYYTGANSLLSNSTIYKVGSKTFFTAGRYVSDDYFAPSSDGLTYLTNLLTHTAFSLGGDSGGCVFTYRNNQNVILGVTSSGRYSGIGSLPSESNFIEAVCSQARYMVPNLGITLY